MRHSHYWIVVLCVAGCGAPLSAEQKPAQAPRTEPTQKPVAGVQLAAAPAVATNPPAETDWPCFLGPTGDSKSPERGIITKWTKDSPRIVWQTELGTGYGAPVVSQGKLYQFDREGDTARLRVFNSRTGEELWTYRYASDYADLYGYDNGPRCSPVVDDNRVYIFGAEGMLHCLSATDGKLVWKKNTSVEYGVIQNFFGVGSTPVIENDLLIVMMGGSPPESQNVPPGQLDLIKGNGTGVVGFDKFTGKEKYRLTNELASYASPTLATINGRRWCFAFMRGGLVGFEPASGKLDFEFPWRAPILESVNASCPVVSGDLVLISETYGPGSALLKVREGGYDVVWDDKAKRRDKSMQLHWNTPIIHGGYLYGSSGRHEGNAEIRCIELATGQVKWSEPDLTRSSLMEVDGHFVCLSEDGILRLLKINPEKYDVVSELRLEDKNAEPNPFNFRPSGLLKAPAWAAPILSHGLLYVRGRDRLVCLELIPKK